MLCLANCPCYPKINCCSSSLPNIHSLTLVKHLPLDLGHGALLDKSLVHVERVEEKVGLVAHTLAEALELGLLEVGLEDGLVDVVGALVDDDAGALAGRKTTDIGKTVLGNDDIEIVLGLVDVRAHGDDARNTVGVGLGGTGRGSVHDGVLGVAEEIGGTTKTVEHAGAHDVGRVGVGVDVDLDGGVHADNTETADDLGSVGDGLGAEEELVIVVVPVLVEALEALGGEADRGGGSEVELAGIEEVEEGILDNLSPDVEVLEVRVLETTNDGVGDVADTGLHGEQVLGETAAGDLVLEELDQVAGDGEGLVVSGGVGEGLIGGGALDDTDNLLGVDGDRSGTDAVTALGDEVGLAVGREVGESDIVETVEAGDGGVDLDDDLVGHLDELGGGTDGGTGDDGAVLLDLGSLNADDIETLVVLAVLGVVALCVTLLAKLFAPDGFLRSSAPQVAVAYVDEISGEHGQVLVEEVDATLVDTLGNVLADLMGRAAVDHVESSPAVLGLGTSGGTDEKAVLELALEAVLLDVVSEHSRDLPVARGAMVSSLFQTCGISQSQLTWGSRHR